MRSLHCQLATLADDSDTALHRASQADARAAQLQEETEQLCLAASQSASKEQVSHPACSVSILSVFLCWFESCGAF